MPPPRATSDTPGRLSDCGCPPPPRTPSSRGWQRDSQANGSEAHAPVVRVLLNATAAGALQNGRFPQGGSFPNGAIVFKEVRPSATGAPTLYVVMVKDRDNARAGNGWLWAEYTPSGTTVFSVDRRGSACISCHQHDGGTVRDLVRTFERQR